MIRRSAPLERRTPLKVDVAALRAWQQRSRKPIPKVGAKTKRERRDLDRARAACSTRRYCEARGIVDAQGRPICGTEYVHEGTDPHHVWPEDRDCGVHDPRRMLWLCRTSHNWVDDHPADAQERGILRSDALSR